jgi:hypothetical protein
MEIWNKVLGFCWDLWVWHLLIWCSYSGQYMGALHVGGDGYESFLQVEQLLNVWAGPIEGDGFFLPVKADTREQ